MGVLNVFFSIYRLTTPENTLLTITYNSRLLRTKHNIFRSTVQVEAHQASVMAECDKCQPLLP